MRAKARHTATKMPLVDHLQTESILKYSRTREAVVVSLWWKTVAVSMVQGYGKELKVPKTAGRHLQKWWRRPFTDGHIDLRHPERVTREVLCWFLEHRTKNCGLVQKKARLLSCGGEENIGKHSESGRG